MNHLKTQKFGVDIGLYLIYIEQYNNSNNKLMGCSDTENNHTCVMILKFQLPNCIKI